MLEIFSTYNINVEKFNVIIFDNFEKQGYTDEMIKNNIEIYIDRLRNGLCILQSVSIIILELLALNIDLIQNRISNYFKQHSLNILHLVDIIEGFKFKFYYYFRILREINDHNR